MTTSREHDRGTRKKNKLVFGFGIDDSDYATRTTINGKRLWCPYYRKWYNMLKRCYCERFHEKQPTYIGCEISKEWQSFMAFRAWMVTHDWQGKQLDKDLSGNGKVYGPRTCVFVTHAVNSFTLDHAAARGDCPLGVSFVRGRYRASISINGKSKHVGYFDTPAEAHQAWVTAKQDQAVTLIEQQTDIRVAVGLWQYALSLAA